MEERKKQLLERLINYDLHVLSLYKENIYSDAGNNIYDLIFLQLRTCGYNRDTADMIIETAMYNYAWYINEWAYAMMDTFIYDSYFEQFNKIVDERCSSYKIRKEDVIAVSSIFYWKRTLIYAAENSNAIITVSDGKDVNIWTALKKTGNLYDLNNCFQDDVESYSPVLDKELLHLIKNTNYKCDYAEQLKNWLFRNCVRIFAFGYVLPDKAVDLVFEATENFLETEFKTKYGAAAYPLSLIIEFIDKGDNNYIRLNANARSFASERCNSADWEIDYEKYNSISALSKNMLSYIQCWNNWRNLISPPPEIHFIFYALALIGTPGYNYYFRKVSQASQVFLNNVCSLISLCEKNNDTLLDEYKRMRDVHVMKLREDDERITDEELEPARNIQDMLTDLNVPNLEKVSASRENGGRPTGIWISEEYNETEASMKALIFNKIWNDLILKVGNFTFDKRWTPLKVKKSIDLLSASIIYTAAQEIGIARKYKESGSESSFHRTMNGLYRRQSLGKYITAMEAFQEILKMKDDNRIFSHSSGIEDMESKRKTQRGSCYDYKDDESELLMTIDVFKQKDDYHAVVMNNTLALSKIYRSVKTKLETNIRKKA